MTKRLLLALSLITLSSAIAEAGPFSYLNQQQYYVSATGAIGVGKSKDTQFRSAGNADRNGDSKFKTGFGFTGAFGTHLWDSWRLELEYSFRRSDYDNFSGSNPASQLPDPISGDGSTHSLMVNFLYDVNLDVNYYWYSGAGIGASFTSLDLGAYGKDTDTNFAFQIMTGLGYRITRDSSLYFGYRLFSTLEQDYRFNNGPIGVRGELEGLNIQHIFEAGVRFDF